METDEILIFGGAILATLTGLVRLSFPRMHRLYFRHAEGLALARLAMAPAMLAIAYVLWNHADPSVVGIYRIFYLVLGFSVILWCGPAAARLAGAHVRVDVLERHNPRAAILASVMILATGLIFAGSLWGEADPGGDGEGGWWIPLGFFISGWFALIAAVACYLWRSGVRAYSRSRRRRNPLDAVGPGFYILSTAGILSNTVAGDFYGWTHGLTALAAIAGMLITREFIGAGAARNGPSVESLLHLLWGGGFIVVSRLFE